MMRQLIVPTALHLLILLAGASVLQLAGARARSVGHAIAMGGLAYALGFATVFAALQFLVVVGVPFILPTIFVVAALLGIPALIGAPRAVVGALGLVRAQKPSAFSIVFGLVLVVAWFYALVAVSRVPLNQWDAWAIWAYKGAIMFRLEHIPVETFQSPGLLLSHYDYPMFFPLWEAAHFRAVGAADTSQVGSLEWIMLLAWAGSAIALAPRSASRLVVLPLVWGTAILMVGIMLSGYADGPLALFLGLGVLALGRWLLERERSDLILGAVLLGGAAGIKNEGIIAGVVIFAALAIVHLRDRRGLRATLIAGVAWLVAFVVPWKIWLAIHDIHGDLPIGRIFDPGYLIDHADRLDLIWRSFVSQVGVGDLSIFVLLAVVVWLLTRGAPLRLRAFTALAAGLYLLSLVAAYWTTPHDITWHLNTSAQRVLYGVAMIGMSAILLLTAPAPTELEDDETAADTAADAAPPTARSAVEKPEPSAVGS